MERTLALLDLILPQQQEIHWQQVAVVWKDTALNFHAYNLHPYMLNGGGGTLHIAHIVYCIIEPSILTIQLDHVYLDNGCIDGYHSFTCTQRKH